MERLDEVVFNFTPWQRVFAALMLGIGGLLTGFSLGYLVGPVDPGAGVAIAALDDGPGAVTLSEAERSSRAT